MRKTSPNNLIKKLREDLKSRDIESESEALEGALTTLANEAFGILPDREVIEIFANNLLFFFETAENALTFLSRTNAWQRVIQGGQAESLLTLSTTDMLDIKLYRALAKDAFLTKKPISITLFLLLVSKHKTLNELAISKQPGKTLLEARKVCADSVFLYGSANWQLAERFYLAGIRERESLLKYLDMLGAEVVPLALGLEVTTRLNGYTISLLPKDSHEIPLLGKTIGNCEHLEGDYKSFVRQAIASPRAGYFAMRDKRKRLVGYAYFSLSKNCTVLTFGEVHVIKNFRERNITPSPDVFLRQIFTIHANTIRAKHPGLAIKSMQQVGFEETRPIGFYRDEDSKEVIERSLVNRAQFAGLRVFEEVKERFSVADVSRECHPEKENTETTFKLSYGEGSMGF